MTKYNILYYFDQAITTGSHILKYEQEQWNIRMSLNSDFTFNLYTAFSDQPTWRDLSPCP